MDRVFKVFGDMLLIGGVFTVLYFIGVADAMSDTFWKWCGDMSIAICVTAVGAWVRTWKG